MRTSAPFPSLLEMSQKAVATAIIQFCSSHPVSDPTHSLVTAVDATCGNGYDTLFLAQTLSQQGRPWQVLALDIQEQAVHATTERLTKAGFLSNTKCLCQSHDTISAYLPQNYLLIAAMYNLGYLPGSSKAVVTTPQTTLRSLKDTANALSPQGIISVHTYGGHTGGSSEMDSVQEWFCTLPWSHWTVATYRMCNKEKNPETVFFAYKKQLKTITQ